MFFKSCAKLSPGLTYVSLLTITIRNTDYSCDEFIFHLLGEFILYSSDIASPFVTGQLCVFIACYIVRITLKWSLILFIYGRL